MRRRIELLGFLVAAVGCGGGTAAPLDAGADDGATLPNTCDTTCQTTGLVVAFGAASATITRAYFGVTTSRASPPSLRIEAYAGGDPGCPTASSATPDYTFLANGVVLPEGVGEFSSFTFFDFVGDVLPPGPPLLTATGGTITPSAANVCLDCIGSPPPSQPDGFVAADVDVQFEGGTAQGHLYATHCDSLDLAE